jgi:hypothetical protein
MPVTKAVTKERCAVVMRSRKIEYSSDAAALDCDCTYELVFGILSRRSKALRSDQSATVSPMKSKLLPEVPNVSGE